MSSESPTYCNSGCKLNITIETKKIVPSIECCIQNIKQNIKLDRISNIGFFFLCATIIENFTCVF